VTLHFRLRVFTRWELEPPTFPYRNEVIVGGGVTGLTVHCFRARHRDGRGGDERSEFVLDPATEIVRSEFVLDFIALKRE
jgi:hypothetical protein